MCTRPIKYPRYLIPIGNFLKWHLFNRSACDNHAIVVPHFQIIKILIESFDMFGWRVLMSMSFYLHPVYLHLKGSIAQQTDQVCFSRNLQGHQIQHDNMEWAKTIRCSTHRVDYRNMFILQQFNSRKILLHIQWHNLILFIFSDGKDTKNSLNNGLITS